MEMEYKIHNFARLGTFSHIIWDIDGTITNEEGDVDQEVIAKILMLGLDGIYHTFITGRDVDWIVERAINPMKGFYNFMRVHDNLLFLAEVGCIAITVGMGGANETTPHPAVANHPLCINQKNIRTKLKQLAYAPHPDDLVYDKRRDLDRRSKVKPPYETIYDANKRGWQIDTRAKRPLCYPYIWSDSKQVFATLEKIRDENGGVKTFDQTSFIEIVKRAIVQTGLSKIIDTEEISTAINIVPKVKGLKLGKSWAAGWALENLCQNILGGNFVLDEVVDRTFAFGDGAADLDFTVPTFSRRHQAKLQHKTLQMAFVGGELDLPRKGTSLHGLSKNITIQATGEGRLALNRPKDVIHLHDAKGATVASAILDFLRQWGYFRPF